MSRAMIMSIFLIVTVLLFHFSGLLYDVSSGDCTTTSTKSLNGVILKELGLTCPQNFGTTAFWLKIIGLVSITGVGVFIGTLVTRSLQTTLFFTVGIGIISVFIAMTWDLILIIMELSKISGMLSALIGAPLIFSWALIIYDFARDRD